MDTAGLFLGQIFFFFLRYNTVLFFTKICRLFHRWKPGEMRRVAREFPARNKTQRKRRSARESGYGGKGEGAHGGLAAPAAGSLAGSSGRL